MLDKRNPGKIDLVRLEGKPLRGMALGAGLSQLDAFMTAHFAKSRWYFTK